MPQTQRRPRPAARPAALALALASALLASAILAPASHAQGTFPANDIPSGLTAAQTPQFIFLGVDDNNNDDPADLLAALAGKSNPDGISNDATFDGEPWRASFYFIGNTMTASAVQDVLDRGHEVGNHTLTHPELNTLTATSIAREIEEVDTQLRFQTPGTVPDSLRVGFRFPFLAIADSAFPVLESLGYRYDCSVEFGWDDRYDGTNFPWPFRLASAYTETPYVTAHPNFWEIPAYPLVLPNTAEATALGYAGQDLRTQAQVYGYASEADGFKITGLDYNLVYQARFSPAQVNLALKHNLNLRRSGNRAPLAYGMHSNYYTTGGAQLDSLVAFLNWALQYPDVRIVSGKQLIDWMENPVGLDGTVAIAGSGSSRDGGSQSPFAGGSNFQLALHVRGAELEIGTMGSFSNAANLGSATSANLGAGSSSQGPTPYEYRLFDASGRQQLQGSVASLPARVQLGTAPARGLRFLQLSRGGQSWWGAFAL